MQSLRLIAVLEAILLFVVGGVYAVVAILTTFMLMLGAYHWTTLTLIGLCAAGALGSIVLAVTLARPKRILMIAGAVLIVMGLGLAAYLKSLV